jgi:hypothetical protein
LDGEHHAYRVFVTNAPGRPYTVIAEYDQPADAEDLIGEAQREGLLAIPSKRFQGQHAFFQIVGLASNIWRWMKLLAGHAARYARHGVPVPDPQRIAMPDHTLRIARLTLLFVAATICFHRNQDEVLSSMHEQRPARLPRFLGYVAPRRKAGLAASGRATNFVHDRGAATRHCCRAGPSHPGGPEASGRGARLR